MNDMTEARTPLPRVPFVDLKTQRERLEGRIEAAIAKVLDHGVFIMGPEVKALEVALSAFSGLEYVVTCANGTDALTMPLMAWGIGPGDAVLVPSFTFAATAEAVALLGGTPIFVDVERDTFNISIASLESAIKATIDAGRLRLRALISVDLFGRPAPYPALADVCRRHGLKLIADAAQGFGATLDGHQAGHWADVVATSFFPAKPLGCYGDGGAILTNDAAMARELRSIRVHGQGQDKYDNVRTGLNSRLDTIQAAILLEKLAAFPAEIKARNVIAARYEEALSDCVVTPARPANIVSTWAQYTVLLDEHDRDVLIQTLKEEGVPTAVYYPRPLHSQTAYRGFPIAPLGAPVSEEISRRVLSLPMHPYLDEAVQDRIVAVLRRALDVGSGALQRTGSHSARLAAGY
jgi:dTDP-4-amino-4,6-dideoxygalactose transaminase